MERRRLGLWDATLLGIGAMISGGVFVLTGIAGARAGPGAILAYLVAGLLATSSALSFAELAPALPRAGGPFDFVTEAFGRFWGFLGGMLYWAGYVAASASYAVAFAIYARRFAPTPPLLVAAGLLVLLGTVNVRAGDRAQALGSRLTLLKTGALVLFVAAGALLLEPGRLQPAFPRGLGPVLEATGVLFLTYLGFDVIATSAEEMKAPDRDLQRALLLSLGIVILVYASVAVVTVGLVPLGSLGEEALATAAVAMGGGTAGLAISLVALAATASASNACIMATSRILYAVGREGLLPRATTWIHGTWRTPHVAVAAASTVMALLVLGGFAAPRPPGDYMVLLASVAALAVLVVFVAVNLAVVVLRVDRPHLSRPFEVPGFPWIPLGAAAVSTALALTMAPLAWGLVLGTLAIAALAFRRAQPWSREHVSAPLARAGRSLAEAVRRGWRTRTRVRDALEPARRWARQHVIDRTLEHLDDLTQRWEKRGR